ncbi:MFS transporter [Rhodopseudomonas palustris]|uniref:MFS transporter n=1 Tax=Rhodopseudomonas palustris TaxID=1076 RepID=UPI0020CE5053|nr:MFS transporter [Rhodopseudomonas palustris]MCP9627110.1 MFS transporter [Rhodopseudomonas palustris]
MTRAAAAEPHVVAAGPVSTGGLSRHPYYAVGAVLLGSLVANVDSRVFSLGLADLRGGLSLSFDQGAWLATASTASQIFMAPAVAWLATVFGLRRVLGVPALIYAAISLLIPFVRDYQLLLVLHIAHGLLLGAFVPATLLIIFRNLPMQWWLPAIAIYAIRVGFTLNAGVSIAGFYVEHLGWQWIYWQDVVVAPLLALLVYLGTPADPINRELLRGADWGGMLLFGSSVAMIYTGLDQGNRLDWLGSGTIVALLGGGTLLLIGFFINEALVKRPWAHAEILLSRNIGLALLAILLFSLTSLSNTALVPNFLVTIAQLKPVQTGPLFMWCAVAPMIVLLPLSIHLVRRYDPKLTMIIGFAAFAAAALLGTRVTSAWTVSDFVPVVLLQSVGVSLTLLAIIIVTLSNSDPTRATAFAAYIQMMRLGCAEIGIALMTTWLRVREQTHSNLLGQHVASGDADVVGTLTKLKGVFAGYGDSLAQARSVGTLAGLVQRQANTLAYIDGFWLTFWFALAGLVCVALIGRAPPGPFTPKRG